MLESDAARRHFVEYFHHHTEIQFAIRAGRAADAVLDQLSFPAVRLMKPRRPSPAVAPGSSVALVGVRSRRVLVLMLTVVAALTGRRPDRARPSGNRGRASRHRRRTSRGWSTPRTAGGRAKTRSPSRDMRAGKVLRLERGLAEIEFDRGARVILQGPAGLELISASSVRLHYGT